MTIHNPLSRVLCLALSLALADPTAYILRFVPAACRFADERFRVSGRVTAHEYLSLSEASIPGCLPIAYNMLFYG